MFLHIGNSKVVALTDLVGIFDVKLKNSAGNNRFFEHFFEGPEPTDHKKAANSFVITTKKVLQSPISPVTLQKRIAKNIQE